MVLVMVLLTNQNKRAELGLQMGCNNWPIHRGYTTTFRQAPLILRYPPDAHHPSVKGAAVKQITRRDQSEGHHLNE